MSYQPLADAPGGIALQPRRVSHHRATEDGEDDTNYEVSGHTSSGIDMTRPFPVDADVPDETHQFTFRAVLVGCLLGSIVGASNIYLGLKTGFTFGSSLFGAIFGYALLKPLSRLPEHTFLGRLLGGPFGPKENCTTQSAATAAGSLGIIFVSAVPAMYVLGLLSTPTQDISKLVALSACAAFFGACFAVPLRSHFVIRERLAFPTPTATAYTIHTLHAGTAGAVIAAKKARALGISFMGVFTWKVLGGFAPGLLVDWHVGWWLYKLGAYAAITFENYGWWLEVTPAFFGAGMLSGLNASWSFLGGTLLAWGILAPWTVSTGRAVGVQTHPDTIPELWSYISLTFSEPEKYRTSPSPRYWLLWPGVLIMLVYSFTEVAFSMLPVLWRMRPTSWRSSSARGFKRDNDDVDPSEQVPLLWWTGGLAFSVVISSVILSSLFGMTFLQAIFALVIGFLFSFIGIQSSGQTDVNPVGTVAKASQVIFGGLARQAGVQKATAQMMNLTAGVVAAGSAGQATDMIGDLKTGYLLRAAPRAQFLAQIIGSVVSIVLNVAIFVLFTRAAPCILTGEQPCTYGAPSVAAWSAVAVGVTSPELPVPPSSAKAAVVFAIMASLTVVAKHTFIPERFRPYIPNWNAIGLGFVVHQTYYSIAMVVGATANQLWELTGPASQEMYMFSISAGLLAGEGMGGVANALLAILKLDGGHGWGTSLGCPAGAFCG